MEKKIIGRLLAVAGLLFLGALAAPAWAVPTAVSVCGTLAAQNSYVLTKDLVITAGSCLIITGNGVTINLNGHSITGGGGGTGISGLTSNNVTIKGPGIVHDFAACISLGTFGLVENVLAYNCATGISFGDASKCVECRVHDARVGGNVGVGIKLGNGCLLESSIVEFSDNGAVVGQDCKVWDLVVDQITVTGLKVGAGTSVARSVISHFHDGPGLDYTGCRASTTGYPTVLGCQDSSNSVWPSLNPAACSIADGSPGTPPNPNCPTFAIAAGTFAPVITDCATNNNGIKYIPAPFSIGPFPPGTLVTQCP